MANETTNSKSLKAGIQAFGRFLSGMIMPNIGAFIAWGLITALFIGTGWIPNEFLSVLVDPTLKYLLPTLIGYTGGRMVGGQRGAVTGAIATIGVIIGADIPMFLGAMIAGPVGGVVIKYFDKLVKGKVKAGFEMLVDNFSIGILGGALAVFFYSIVGPFVQTVTSALGAGVDFLVTHGVLPLASIIVEPAKVLFLNNAINHGVFTPLGTEQVAETGKSILFMVESNPGPGLGLLLALTIFGTGMAKQSAPGAAIIQFLGGIHEIYFPYVLMKPAMILALIGGGVSGVFTLSILGGGTVGPPSPGSIFAEMIMTPRDGYFANISGIVVASAVTFILASLILKISPLPADDDALSSAQTQVSDLKAESKGQASASDAPIDKNGKAQLDAAATGVIPAQLSEVQTIIFACDAGMGSSVMGASTLSKKIQTAGIKDVSVDHRAVNDLDGTEKVIVVHSQLAERAKQASPNAHFVVIEDFLNAPQYAELVEQLKTDA
ncbi:MAG: PTS mannitol transporter subunit IICB [Bifidobacteriaceae bacterium]|jgi:PTS system mannitol-specific IIC component|nr:PTS mannitol transporter subunit IICB [Bifidobacteriaceae bacterium]